MTVPEVVLHIGQPKTGTTSLQNLLAQQRASLCEAGALYPDLGQGNQWLAMGELLLQDPEARRRMPTGLRKHLTELLAGLDGQFDQLARQCKEFRGSRVIISAENLVYAGRYTIDRLSDVFGSGQAVKVVITTRPVSDLLGSAYQQLARIQAVDDFETWVRAAVGELLAGHADSTIAWARVDVLRGNWTRPGWRTTIVDMNGHPSTTNAQLWQHIVPNLPCPQLAAVDNRSYPAALVTANQAYIRRHPELSVARLEALQRRAFGTHLREPDYGTLGRFQIRPEVKALLDRAFPQGGSTAVAASHVEDLQRRLRSSEALTCVDLAPGVSGLDWAGKVAGLTAVLERADTPTLARRSVRRVRKGFRSLRRVVEVE